jgi:hypothetical protein
MHRSITRFTLAGLSALLAITAPLAYAQKDGGKETAKQTTEKPDAKTKKTHPEQSSVATKKEFGTVAEKDSSVTKALDAAKLDDLKKQEDKETAFKGTVAKVFTAKGNSLLILNFAKNYKDAATAVLRPANYDKFPDMKKLLNKKVLVSGKIELYNGSPEIVLTKPEQIKIIKESDKS